MTTRSSCFLLLLLAACGRTEHGPTTHEPAAQSPSPVDDSNANAAGGAPAENCLYPRRRQERLANPNTDQQALRLSNPYPIQLQDDPDNLASLAATFDVNGDQVSDLFFLSDAGRASPLRLLLSAPPPNIFDYSETSCSALEQLPAARRLFLRDLDADGVQDFIVATNVGVRAFLNHQDGLESVLDSVVAAADIAVINLDTADLDGDGRTDLVLSYDRVETMDDSRFETGIVMYRQNPDGTLVEKTRSATNYVPYAAPIGDLYTGYFALARYAPTAPPVVVATTIGDIGAHTKLPFSDGTLAAPGVIDALNQLAKVKDRDGREYLGAIGLDHFYILDLSETPARVAFEGPLVYSGNFAHSHYGDQDFPRFFFYDVDADGDDDFVESRDGPARPDQPELALHVNLGGQVFAEPQRFPIHLNNTTDAPFVVVGPGSGLVTSPDSVATSSAVYTLYPAANAAP